MRLSHGAMAGLIGAVAGVAVWAADPSSKPAKDASVSQGTQVSDEAPVNNSRFHKRLLEIARDYETLGRVDDQYRWAPGLCSAVPQPSVARFSASTESATHGRKLYFLFAKERDAYLRLGAEPHVKNLAANSAPPVAHVAPVGQVIVKESWIPRDVTEKEKDLPKRQRIVVKPIKAPTEWQKTMGASDAMDPYALREGKLYHAREKHALFIMVKLDPATPDTDQGWVYGTVTADGKRVTSAGKVASCMACHREAPHDRQFGLVSESK